MATSPLRSGVIAGRKLSGDEATGKCDKELSKGYYQILRVHASVACGIIKSVAVE